MDLYRETAITAIVTILLIIVLLWMYDLIYELQYLNRYPRQLGDTSESDLQLVPWGQYREFSDVEQYRYRRNRRTQCRSRAPFQELEYKSHLPSEPIQASQPTLSDVPPQLKVTPIKSQVVMDIYTPFLTACWECDVFKIASLIHEGVDIHQTTTGGETGLVLATYQMAKRRKAWNPMCLHILVYNGCSINEPTNVGNTALHIAVKQGHLAVTKWLLQHGASVSVKNRAGWRPEAIAHAQRRHDILSLLQGAESSEDSSKTEDAEKGGKVEDEEVSREAEEEEDSIESEYTKNISVYDSALYNSS